MPLNPDIQNVIDDLAPLLRNVAGQSRNRGSATDAKDITEALYTAVALKDTDGVVFAVGRMRNWAEQPQTFNGENPPEEYRRIAEAWAKALDYLDHAEDAQA